ncbi:MAG: hypothetical protein ACLTHL_07730 [Collinsella sp.]
MTRPVVEAGKIYGLLPGGAEEKISPWRRSALDALLTPMDRLSAPA